MDIGQYQDYAKALEQLTPAQAALTLSTQGLTNEQIMNTLALKTNADTHEKLTAAEQYQALADAGLLASKKTVTAATMEQTLQTVLGSDADTSAIVAKMGLKTATDAEGNSTVILTTKKLQAAVASGTLTTAEAAQIAAILGVSGAINVQTASVMPKWIAIITAATKAIWAEVTATAAWLTTNPVGWCVAIGAALGSVVLGISKYNKHIDELREKTQASAEAYSSETSAIDDYVKKYEDLHSQLSLASGDEEKIYEIKQQLLELQKELNDKYGDEAGKLDLVTDAYKNQADAIKNLSKVKAEEYLNDPDNATSLKLAEKKMTEKKSFNLSSGENINGLDSSEALKEIAGKYEDQGIKINSVGEDQFQLRLEDVDPEQAYDTLNKFITDLRHKAKELGDEHIFDDVITLSGNALKQSKDTIDDWGDIFKKKQLAEIADDEKMSSSMNNATASVEKYNEAVLKSSDPFNDEEVANAYKNMQTQKEQLLNSDDWQNYGKVIDDVFSQADTSSYEFYQHLKNDNELAYAGNQLKGMTDTEVKALMDSGAQIDVLNKKYGDAAGKKSAIDTLKKAVDKAGKSVDEVVDDLVKLGYISGNIGKKTEQVFSPLSKQDMISEINGLSEGFEELDKIMTSMKDKDKKFDYSLLDDKKFKDNFQNYTAEYQAFIDAITNSPKDVTACQSAFDNLTSAFIYNSKVIKGLSDDNADVAKQYLELMGVQNADQVVTSALAQVHAEAAWNAQDLSNATYDEISALAQESEATAGGQKAFELYQAKKILAETPFDPLASIENLKAIVKTLGIASDAWVGYYAAMNRMKQIYDSGETSYNEDGSIVSNQELINQYKDIAKIRANQLQGEIDVQLQNVQVSNYTGPKSTNPQKGSKGSQGAKDNSTIDWISRSADLLERESKRLETALQDTWTAYTGLSEEDIERVQELFNMPLSPDSKEVDELMDYASKLGISIGELQKLSENGGLQSRQSILTQKIDADQKSLDQAKESLDYYKQSYEEYVSKVPEYRDKIENGGTDIESFTSDQKAQIDKAIQAFDSWKDSEEKVKELQKTIRDEKGTYYDNIVDGAAKENEKLADANDLIQKQIDLLNTQGAIVSADMYEEMMSNTEDQIDTYQQILQARQDELADSMERGLEPGTEEWYKLVSAVMEAKGNIKDLEKEQANLEKQLRELPVTNLEKLGNIYQSILDTIQNWGAEMEASGKTLDADYYQKLINNANTSISNYKEEIEAIQDVMSDYDPGTDNWNEMNDKLQQCNSSISSLVQNMHKWNEELLNLPIQKISDASDSLSKIVDGLNDVKSEHETVISAVTGAISDEIDRLNDEKEAYEDTINDQKEALQDRMDLLDKQNEKLKLQAQYEQALYDLSTVTTQHIDKVVREGEITYESNADNLRNAEESVQDALAALKKQELQDQMDALDDALDDYNDKLQDTLDSLQKISDKWSEIASKKEQQVNETTATDILGNGWKDKVLSGNDADIFQMFSKLYTDNVDQINKYQEQIDSTEHISSLIQEYIDSYKAGTLTYEEAQAGIHDLVSQMNKKMSAMDNLQNIYNYMGKVYDTAADGNSVFAGIQKAFKESGDQLISFLEQYQANAGLISESMSSWQQLTNNVESIKDILEDVKDNLKDTERDSDSKKDKDDNVRGSGNSHVTGKHSSKSVYGSSGFSAEKHHSGVFSGAVGSSSADKTDKIRVLEAEKLGPNEIPAVLERGEMVFTPEQMEKLVASFSATAYVPDNSWIKNMYPSATVNTKPNIVNVSVGDVKLTDVRDVDGFAKAMGKDFVPLARQALARF